MSVRKYRMLLAYLVESLTNWREPLEIFLRADTDVGKEAVARRRIRRAPQTKGGSLST